MTFKRVTSPQAGDATHFGGTDVNKFSDYLGGTDIIATEQPEINTATVYRNGVVKLRNPANSASLILRNPTPTADGQTGMLNEPYDFFIFTDASDSNVIKAKRGDSQEIKYSHATDFGNVFNSCVAALPAAGGQIIIGAGTFLTTTTCTFKHNMTVMGAGMNATIIKLANSANVDVMATPSLTAMIAARPGTGYGTETNVIHDVTLENFSIDGNESNNATGRYGLAKIGYAWNITNLCVYNCKSDGIYSEWGTVAGCPGGADVTKRCMEDYWVTVYIHHCDGKGLTFRGPHDTNMTNLMVWGCVGNAASFEASGTLYSGGCYVNNYHCFAAINSNTTMTVLSTEVHGSNWAIEGGIGTGIGVHIQAGGNNCIITGSRFFLNGTGLKIDASIGYATVEGCEFDNNGTGATVLGNHNKISGNFHDNTTTDIKMGDGSSTAAYNDIRSRCTRTPLALDWGNTGNTMNYVALSVVMLDTHAALSGTPDVTNNYVSIWAVNASNSRTPALIQPFMPVPILPSQKKVGTWHGITSGATLGGEGLLSTQFTIAGAGASKPTPGATDGNFVRYTTGTSTDNSAGILIPATTVRAWNARMRIKFRIDNTACRVFLGWRGNVVTPTGEDPFNADPDFCIGKRAADTIWQVIRNDGTGATVYANVTGSPTIDTAIHTVDFWTDSSGYGLRLDGGADNYFTTDIPSSSHWMGLVFHIQTTGAAARYIDMFYIEIVQDK